ncbi:3'-5' exonuclease [Halomonas sp. GXIMD04776]|uniref:3'-5' exonuclease n=1 Tax=Halomonas sp. GXIMD04776 TaxID=3415605 RepID=UPI003C930EE4
MGACAQLACDSRLERFYSIDIPAPQTPIADAPLVALDMETTGLSPERHGIVSIGVLPFTLQRIPLASRRYWVVRPRQPLSEESIAFHHITHSEIATAPDLDDVLAALLETLAGRLVVVHYRNIERPFLDRAVRTRMGERLLFPMIDTMQLEASLHRKRRWAWLKRLARRPSTSLRLAESRQRYHLPFYSGHHALGDALATAELFQAQIARHYSPQTPISDLWC